MVNNKFLLIIGLASSLTVQAGSAESFCADLIKNRNEVQTGDCSKCVAGSFEELVYSVLDPYILSADDVYYLGIYPSFLEKNMMTGEYKLTSLNYGPSLKQQFQNCISKKKQEQSDSGFLKYLDKY
jgi:hypothetical protein